MNKTALHRFELVKFFADGSSPRVLRARLTEQQAKDACNAPSTRKPGEWFIGFREMRDRYSRDPRRGTGSITMALLAKHAGLGGGRANQGQYDF